MAEETVVVSWPKDRDRFRRVLGEFPAVRRSRMCVAYGTLMSVVFMIVVVLGDLASPAMVFLVATPALVMATLYFGSRAALLRDVGTGSLTWTFDDRGLRVDGPTATEIPWTEMAGWRTAADHLVIEVRRPNGRPPNLACAAPLSAFDALERERTEDMLRNRVRPAVRPR